MSRFFRGTVVFTVAVVLCAATFVLVPRLRDRTDDAAGADGLIDEDTARMDEIGAGDSGPALSDAGSGRLQPVRSASPAAADREKAKFDVGEMRNEVENMLLRFRGTPEERQDVIDECENGKELIRLIADISESSIEEMSPEELEKERESFEKDYRAQLDYLQTGRLQRMLRTPEEQEVIGSTIEAVRDFLERIDGALRAAGY